MSDNCQHDIACGCVIDGWPTLEARDQRIAELEAQVAKLFTERDDWVKTAHAFRGQREEFRDQLATYKADNLDLTTRLAGVEAERDHYRTRHVQRGDALREIRDAAVCDIDKVALLHRIGWIKNRAVREVGE